VEEQKLLASDGAEDDRFGVSVSISGNVALVGAYLDDENGTNSGSVYVYALGDQPIFCKADFNDDGKVDDTDLNIFSQAMGEIDCTWWPAYCECDMDNDKDVDGTDLAVLTAEFGRKDCQ
jgi:hypothetical protein